VIYLASIAEIQSKIAEQQRINRELRQELYELESGVSQAASEWSSLTSQINTSLINGAGRVTNSHELTLKAYELQGEIEKLYKLFKNVEMANKNIRSLQNKIYYDFANYNAVRKIVEALLNNIEFNYVNENIITKAVEVKHLQMPDYWLTCALLAIMAWKNDDKDKAQRALEKAMELDKKNTSIFFFAIYMRFERESVALKWFESYIGCELTGDDDQNILFMMSIVSRTVESECDEKTYAVVNKFITYTLESRLSAEGYSEDNMVIRVAGYMNRSIRYSPMDRPFLSKYCKESGVMQQLLNTVKNNENVLELIRNIINITDREKRNRLNTFIDNVIARANTVEVGVRNDIRYNETVIKHHGEVEKAKAEHNAWLEHNKSALDIVSEFVDWVYDPKDEDICPAERQCLFLLTKHISEKAVDYNVSIYRRRHKDDFDIQIDDYQTHAHLSDVQGESSKIESFCGEQAAALIAQQKLWKSFIWFGAAILALAGAILIPLEELYFITGVGAVGGVISIIAKQIAKKRISENYRRKAETMKSVFVQLNDDFNEYEREFAEYDAYYDEIKAEFAKL